MKLRIYPVSYRDPFWTAKARKRVVRLNELLHELHLLTERVATEKQALASELRQMVSQQEPDTGWAQHWRTALDIQQNGPTAA